VTPKAFGPAAVLAGIALLAGCSRAGETVPPAPAASATPRLTSRVVLKARNEWRDVWDSLAQRPPAYGPGSEWELLEIEATPFGPKQSSTLWVLLEVDQGGSRGRFEVRGADGRSYQTERAFHHYPSHVIASSFRDRDPNPELPGSGPLAPVSTAAGDFACARTFRGNRRSTGENLDVSLWWAPNTPVPVQSWERPVAESDRLRDPPADPDAMPVGCKLQRLVRIKLVPPS
jgi:hypothetical protein